jgi:hypothetical protein
MKEIGENGSFGEQPRPFIYSLGEVQINTSKLDWINDNDGHKLQK